MKEEKEKIFDEELITIRQNILKQLPIVKSDWDFKTVFKVMEFYEKEFDGLKRENSLLVNSQLYLLFLIIEGYVDEIERLNHDLSLGKYVSKALGTENIFEENEILKKQNQELKEKIRNKIKGLEEQEKMSNGIIQVNSKSRIERRAIIKELNSLLSEKETDKSSNVSSASVDSCKSENNNERK